MGLNDKTKRLAVIGDPIEHSLSPAMHREFIKLSGDDAEYTKIHVTNKTLADMMEKVRTQMCGINVTAPHKVAVMEYLDEISDDARLFGAVNTVVNDSGRLIGYNTDAKGFYASLLREGIDVKDKEVLFFGAGGATKSVCMYLAMKKAKSITVINRTKEKAIALGENIKSAIGYEIKTEMELPHYDVVINTTSAGMAPQLDVLPYAELDFIDENTAVVDMIYNPPETKFLKLAKEKGARTLNGLGMLICQGIFAYELFMDTKLPEGAFDAAKAVIGR